MTDLLCIAHVPTPALTRGFLPAARRLGLRVTVLTDSLEAQQRDFEGRPLEQRPDRLLGCDVFHPVAILDCISQHGLRADAVFSNSDHLQTPTAVVAAYFGVPGKPVRGCYLAKNKAEMRRELARRGLEVLWTRLLVTPEDLQGELRFPCVAKPCKGVASQGVEYLVDRAGLASFSEQFWKKRPGMPILLEEYLPGTIYSVETLGDAAGCHLLGGFTCSLTPLPYFIETGCRWGFEGAGPQAARCVLDALEAIEATFGACHTELVAAPDGPRIIEVNYRSIGDGSDFQLHNMLGERYFDEVLRVQLGQPFSLPPAPSDWHSAASYLFSARAGTLAEMPPEAAFERDGCKVVRLPLLKAGDVLDLSHSNKDYTALLHVTGPGRERVEALLDSESRATEEAIRWV